MGIIGIVGPFGSGCTFVADILHEKHGYEILSLSKILRKIVDSSPDEYGGGSQELTREKLQEIGNSIRKNRGNDYLAREASRVIEENPEKSYVIDSIRNPAEIAFLRSEYASFFLFGIFAEADIRWERVKEKYNHDRRKFNADDEKDSGRKEADYGQKVTDSFRMADVIMLNNVRRVSGNQAYKDFLALLKEKVDIINGAAPFRPNQVETNMVLAYAVSMRSSCLKRKVGAVIVDNQGAVFSSGYNEVPLTQPSCLYEYGKCYRDQMKNDFREDLQTILKDAEQQESVYERFKEFKILDYCRALHAEENAILNVARIGASSTLSSSVLYTSTYPCNLCANKIAQVGIQEIVYFEPYPMEEAKKILSEKGIKQSPFQGITYNGYFRLMEVVS